METHSPQFDRQTLNLRVFLNALTIEGVLSTGSGSVVFSKMLPIPFEGTYIISQGYAVSHFSSNAANKEVICNVVHLELDWGHKLISHMPFKGHHIGSD